MIAWGLFAIADGIAAIVGGAKSRWWAVVIWGVVGVLAGGVALFMPGITALALLMVVAAWAIVRGIFEIVAAIRLRKEITGEWFLILSGLVSIALGAFMFLFPGAGALALIWVIGLHAFVVGVLLILLAFRLRGLGKRLQQRPLDGGIAQRTRGARLLDSTLRLCSPLL